MRIAGGAGDPEDVSFLSCIFPDAFPDGVIRWTKLFGLVCNIIPTAESVYV